MKLRKSMTVNAAAMMLIAGVALAAAAFLAMPTTRGDDLGHRWRAASQMHRFAVIAGFLISVLGLGGLLDSLARRKRNDELGQAGAPLGFTLVEDLETIERGASSLPSLERSGFVGALLRGSAEDAEALLFDYVTAEGKHSSVQTVACFRLSRPLPEFQLCPEDIGHKIAAVFGYQDINFEAHPEFSKAYVLRGKDEASVRAAFHPELIRALEKELGWSIEFSAGWLCIFRRRRRVPGGDLRKFLQDAGAVFRLFAPR